MILTDEQKAIINSKENSFKINAVAGSGKTTTLLEYAKKNKDLKILYLAYNKSLQKSLSDKLLDYNLPNMQISTIHSLAYNKIAAYKYKLCFDLKPQVVESMIIEFEHKMNKKYYPTNEYIALIKDLVNFYCNSSLIQLDKKFIEAYTKQTQFSIKLIKLLNEKKLKALSHTKYILSAMRTKKIEATHDFYLKMFYLNKSISSNLKYDLILVDEAQDISDVMIAIVESQNCKRVYVGDSFQQMYSFRYATNALNKIKLPSYNLSYSFRFSNSYAKYLQKNLNKIYSLSKNNNLFINGMKKYTNFEKNSIDKSKQFTIISRTSFGLIQQLVRYIHDDINIYFEGGYNSYSFMNQTVYSIFYLKMKKNDKITQTDIKNFETYSQLEQFAKDTKNQDYLNIIKFINTYGDNIFEINKKVKQKVCLDKNSADIIFTTTHKSKGLEYNQVLMTDDFITKKDASNNSKNLSKEKIAEELNIYYVASTRVKDAIELTSLE